MQKALISILAIFSFFILDQSCGASTQAQAPVDRVDKIEMKLSAFGVESDGFPNIEAVIDLRKDTSYCRVSYFDPKYKSRVYRLQRTEMDSIRFLISNFDIRQLHADYRVSKTDQPTSTVVLYLGGNSEKIEISDYGLEGPSPLPELYRIVYKLDINAK